MLPLRPFLAGPSDDVGRKGVREEVCVRAATASKTSQALGIMSMQYVYIKQ